MAKKMSFTDIYEDTYPESYWRPELVTITKDNGGLVIFKCYAEESKKGKRIVAQKEFPISPADADTYFIKSNTQPLKAAYDFMDARSDFFTTATNI